MTKLGRISRILFLRIEKEGKRLAGGPFSVRYISKTGLESVIFSAVVSNKVASSAVARNRLKRRLRAIVRENIKELKPGVGLVIYTRKEIIKSDLAELRSELSKIFSQII